MITAVASFVEGTVALAAAFAAAGVLLLREPRSRALAMPVALALALGAVALISGVDDLRRAVGARIARGGGRPWPAWSRCWRSRCCSCGGRGGSRSR